MDQTELDTTLKLMMDILDAHTQKLNLQDSKMLLLEKQMMYIYNPNHPIHRKSIDDVVS